MLKEFYEDGWNVIVLIADAKIEHFFQMLFSFFYFYLFILINVHNAQVVSLTIFIDQFTKQLNYV